MLSFELTEDQQAFRTELARYARTRLRPAYAERAAKTDFPWEAHKELAALGVLGIGLPEEFGGTGVSPDDPVTLGMATETLAYGDVNVAAAPVQSGLVAAQLAEGGSRAVQERYIPELISGDAVSGIAVTEPGAGSDAAGIRTRATRTDGGWKINGQKVWTSGAHLAAFGLATVRTNPDVPKHQGITTMVIDMHAPGVTVRPLKMPNGDSDFNEVFFDDVFVPEEDVVGPVDSGWTVARATLGNESVSIGGGDGARIMPIGAFIAPLDAHPERLAGGAGRVGRHIARTQAMGVLNQRSAYRAVAGGGPGPEGNVTKLVLSELGHETAAILAELAGPDAAFLEGDGAMGAMLMLMNRALSIAGGTSEIKRNQIAERILGLPRDPLIN